LKGTENHGYNRNVPQSQSCSPRDCGDYSQGERTQGVVTQENLAEVFPNSAELQKVTE
jgi:hypothetical protein